MLPQREPIVGAELDELCVNTLRTLALDAVEAANSGHPGAPMGLAPVAYCLWQRVLRYDPDDPIWPNRDRFVLSCGHASMLLYGILHLAGVKEVNGAYERLDTPAVPLDEIKRFRQLGSKTPGHPEYRWTSGVEATTGPLGQGLGMSVGMALAERWLAARYNRPGLELFDYKVYALCGDGDLMEGVSHEAASLAGHLGLGNLCWIYDNNRVSLDGPTALSFSEDVAGRFASCGWDVSRVADANDLDAVEAALRAAGGAGRPTLIIVDSHIGYGAPHAQDTAAAHGAPLGEAEVRLAKRAYGWPEDARFLVPAEVRAHFADGLGARGRAGRDSWMNRLEAYQSRHPELHDELFRLHRRLLPDGWDRNIPEFPPSDKGLATREAAGKVLDAVGRDVPWLVGGSADLSSSTKAKLPGDAIAAGAFAGRNVFFGVREHAMGSIVNGLTLSKVRAFGATFLTFSDYMRPAIRLSSLMEIPSVWVFTHDSISLGEDGPTHQPVEHLLTLRAVPGLLVLRPADANEVAWAWRVILQLRHRPACLVLSRQALPVLDRTRYAPAAGVARGAYVLADAPDGRPDAMLLATGSEVSLCVRAREQLAAEGVRVRVVSMPSWELFDEQSSAYRDEVLPPGVTARVAVEQAAALGWERYVGPRGTILGLRTFGRSAPQRDLQDVFGFTVERIVAAVKEQRRRR
jgi:transketolase